MHRQLTRVGSYLYWDVKFPSAVGCNSGHDLYQPLLTQKKSLVFDMTLLQKLLQYGPIVWDSDVRAAVSTVNSPNYFSKTTSGCSFQ